MPSCGSCHERTTLLRTPSRFLFLFCAVILLPCRMYGQSCPITIIGANPRAAASMPSGSIAPFLRIMYQNNSPFTIVRFVFQVHFPGALGEFQSSYPLNPGMTNKSTWSDAAFIKSTGDALDLDVRIVRVEFSTGTNWIDDGSHACSRSFDRRHVQSADDAPETHRPEVSGGQASFSVARSSSLLVPATENGLGSIPVFPQEQRVSLPASTIVRVSSEDVSVTSFLSSLPVDPMPISARTFAPVCPVVANYLDLGGNGRLYTSLMDHTRKTVKMAQFTVRVGGMRQTLQMATPLTPGKSADTTWQTSPALLWTEPVFLQLDRVTYADSSVWADPGKDQCITAAQPSVESRPAEEPKHEVDSLPVIVTGVIPFEPGNHGTTSKAPTVGVKSPQPPAVPTLRAPAASTSPSPKVSPAKSVALREDASPQAFRENVPLIKENKASLCTITTSPAGGQVTLDGKRLGSAPLVFIMVKTGKPRELDITLDGYKSVHSSYSPNGQTIPVDVHFSPAAQ